MKVQLDVLGVGMEHRIHGGYLNLIPTLYVKLVRACEAYDPLLEQRHQRVQNCAKYKKWLILHILLKKIPTLVLAKLCIYTKVLQ